MSKPHHLLPSLALAAAIAGCQAGSPLLQAPPAERSLTIRLQGPDRQLLGGGDVKRNRVVDIANYAVSLLVDNGAGFVAMTPAMERLVPKVANTTMAFAHLEAKRYEVLATGVDGNGTAITTVGTAVIDLTGTTVNEAAAPVAIQLQMKNTPFSGSLKLVSNGNQASSVPAWVTHLEAVVKDTDHDQVLFDVSYLPGDAPVVSNLPTNVHYTVTTSASGDGIATQAAAPYGYFADRTAASLSSTLQATANLPTPLGAPLKRFKVGAKDLVLDGAGNLWTSSGTNVVRVSTADQVSTFNLPAASGQGVGLAADTNVGLMAGPGSTDDTAKVHVFIKAIPHGAEDSVINANMNVATYGKDGLGTLANTGMEIQSMAVDEQDKVWFTGFTDLVATGTLGTADGATVSTQTTAYHPAFVAVDKSGHEWVLEQNNYNPSSNIAISTLTVYNRGVKALDIPGNHESHKLLTIGPDGSPWFFALDSTSTPPPPRIFREKPLEAGGYAESSYSSQHSTISSLAIGPDNGVWFADTTDQSITHKRDSGTEFYQVGGRPQSLAVDANDTLWLCSLDQSKVERITAAGAHTTYTFPNDLPVKLVLDGAGNPWVMFDSGDVVELNGAPPV